jgi:hypothetical protein
LATLVITHWQWESAKKAPLDTKASRDASPEIIHSRRGAPQPSAVFAQLSQALNNFSFQLAFVGDWRETLTQRPASR